MGNFFLSVANFLGGEVNGLGKPVNISFLSVLGEFFMSLLVAIGDGLMFLLYVIIRFVLNIVDFLQFFVEKLMGLDYWGKGTASVDTLGESDIIFRFLSNENVLQVFKYMIGIFIVLLIVFSIIAIVKTEYAYAASNSDKNSKGSILTRALKACMLVVLLPVLIIMGILASNAILTSLVNAFNINNNLTMGGQVFTASAYDANKYRQYAKRNIRLGVTSNVAVTEYDLNGDVVTIMVPASIKAIIPREYKSDSPFTGFFFTYEGTEYLYYVEQSELEYHYNHYVTYLTQILGATLTPPAVLGASQAVTGGVYSISVALHPLDKEHRLNQAAYNTWNYNELFTRDTLTFDKTVDYTHGTSGNGFTSDSGNVFADARYYTNSSNWAKFFDGGTNGLVVIPDEYYVMADIVDFMMAQGVEISYVNVANPLIDWDYIGTGTYFNGRYLYGCKGAISSNFEFMVNYADAGYTVYKPNLTAMSEEKGAIYIMAYYSSANNSYIPVVHNKEYIDDYGNKCVFTSSSLDVNYEGLIVARGVLDSTFKNRVGQPTLMTTDYNDSTGYYVGIDTPHYMQVSSSQIEMSAETALSFDVELVDGSSYPGFTKDVDSSHTGTLVKEQAGGYKALFEAVNAGSDISGYKEEIDSIAGSLPTGFTLSTLLNSGSVTNTILSDIVWKYTDPVSITAGASSTTYLVFKSIDNVDVITNDLTKNTSVPLLCFVELRQTGVRTTFAYSHNSDGRFSSGILYRVGNDICANEGDVETRVATLLLIGTAQTVQTGLKDNSQIPQSIVAKLGTDFVFPDERKSLNDSGSILAHSASNDITTVSTPDVEGANDYSYVSRDVLELMPAVTGALISGKVYVGTWPFDGSFIEYQGTREETSTYTDYFFGWVSNTNNADISGARLNVKLRVDKNTGEVVMTVYDIFKLIVEGEAIKVGNSELLISAYDMQFVSSGTEYDTYRYKHANSQYYYFNFTNVDGNLTPSDTNYMMYKLTINYYNLFTYRVGTDETYTIEQYDPSSQVVSEAELVKVRTYYLREESVVFGSAISQTADGEGRIYNGTLYKEDNHESVTARGSVLTSFYVILPNGVNPNAEQDLSNCLSKIYTISSVDGSFSRVPLYADATTAQEILGETKPHIQFYRHSFGKGVIRFDASFNPLGLFGEANLFRLKLAILQGVSDVEETVLKFSITNGRLYLDYNFNSVPHLTINTYYVPGLLNVVVLVFAAILLLTVLGQAVWGLVARVYDIVLYFIIMPGVVSTTVIQSDSKMYNTWQSNLISKVMGAYGVMLGINFFFLIVPAIREASQIFTDHDIATSISQGSWLSFLTADALNNLVYILFLLVAFTIIKTLPGTIGGLIGLKKGDEVYGAGASVKKSVDGMIDEVSHHLSGQSLMEAPGKAKKMLQNFIPGSEIYEAWKKKNPVKKNEESGLDYARREAQDEQERARQQSQEANASQEATRTPTSAIPQDVGVEANASQEIAQNANETQQTNATETQAENATGIPTDAGTSEEGTANQEAGMKAEAQGLGGDSQDGQVYAEAAASSASDAAASASSAASSAGSATSSANASRIYSDISSGNMQEYIEKATEEANAEKNKTRDEKKLEKLEQELADAQTATNIAPWQIESAFNKFNEGKDLDEQILEDTTYYNSEFSKRVTEKQAKSGIIATTQAEKEVKEELALAHWNKTHNEKVSEEEFKNNRRLRADINNEFKDIQAKRMAEAKNDVITSKIQDKIDKQKTKMALKEQGAYESIGKKVLLSAPRLLSRKMTDLERVKLADKRDATKAKLDTAKEYLASQVAGRQKLEAKAQELEAKKKEVDSKIANIKSDIAERERKMQYATSEKTKQSAQAKIDALKADLKSATAEQNAVNSSIYSNDSKKKEFDDRIKQAEGAIKSKEREVLNLEARLNSNYSGLLPSYIIGKQEESKQKRFAKAGAKLTEKYLKEAIKVEKQETKEFGKHSVEHSRNAEEKFTESQIRKLDSKRNSITATNKQLEGFKRSYGYMFDEKGKKLDKNAIKRELDKREKEAVIKAGSGGAEAEKVKAMYAQARNSLDKDLAKYKDLIDRREKEQKAYNKVRNEFSKQNQNSFVTADSSSNKLNKKRIKMAEANKARIIHELNEKNRRGTLSEAEERSYISAIQDNENVLDDLRNRTARYKATQSLGAKIKNSRLGKMVGTASTFAGDTAYVAGQNISRGVKRGSATKAYMQSGEYKQRRDAKIAERSRLDAREREKIINEVKRGKAIKQEQAGKNYVNMVKKELAKSGLSSQIAGIKTAEDAQRIARVLGTNTRFASLVGVQTAQQKSLEQAIMHSFNKSFDKIAQTKSTQSDYKNIDAALARSKKYQSLLKNQEKSLRAKLKAAPKNADTGKLVEQIANVQSQLKALKTLDEKTAKQMKRLTTSMKKIQRKEKSSQYSKYLGADKSKDAKK